MSRMTADKRKVYSQIIRIYHGLRELYHAAVVDLIRRPGLMKSDTFYPSHYWLGFPEELLVPLKDLTFVDYTPNGIDGYFDPAKVSSQLSNNFVMFSPRPIN